MELLDSDRAFLQKRSRFVRSWRYVGPTLTCIIAVIGGWLFVQYPLLANPAHVVAELQNGGIDQKTTELMAALTTVRLRIEQSQLVSAVETEREIGGIGKGLLQRHFLEQRDREDL